MKQLKNKHMLEKKIKVQGGTFMKKNLNNIGEIGKSMGHVSRSLFSFGFSYFCWFFRRLL